MLFVSLESVAIIIIYHYYYNRFRDVSVLVKKTNRPPPSSLPRIIREGGAAGKCAVPYAVLCVRAHVRNYIIRTTRKRRRTNIMILAFRSTLWLLVFFVGPRVCQLVYMTYILHCTRHCRVGHARLTFLHSTRSRCTIIIIRIIIKIIIIQLIMCYFIVLETTRVRNKLIGRNHRIYYTQRVYYDIMSARQ